MPIEKTIFIYLTLWQIDNVSDLLTNSHTAKIVYSNWG